MKSKIIVLLICSMISILFYSFSYWNKTTGSDTQYTCTPCGAECDNTVFDKPGTCTQCNMALVDKSTISHKNIQPGKMCELDENEVIFRVSENWKR